MTYARGNRAWGECARSGRRMLLRDLVRDGLYPHLLVDPAWYEPPYPIEQPAPVADPVALRNPSPRRDRIDAEIRFPLFDVATGRTGSELFEILPRQHVLTEDQFKVALYHRTAPADYSGMDEIEDAGYVPGGLPLATHVKGDRLVIADAEWVGVSLAASALLVYEAETGEGLFRTELGAVHASENGRFAIMWHTARFEIDESRTRLRKIIA